MGNSLTVRPRSTPEDCQGDPPHDAARETKLARVWGRKPQIRSSSSFRDRICDPCKCDSASLFSGAYPALCQISGVRLLQNLRSFWPAAVVGQPRGVMAQTPQVGQCHGACTEPSAFFCELDVMFIAQAEPCTGPGGLRCDLQLRCHADAPAGAAAEGYRPDAPQRRNRHLCRGTPHMDA